MIDSELRLDWCEVLPTFNSNSKSQSILAPDPGCAQYVTRVFVVAFAENCYIMVVRNSVCVGVWVLSPEAGPL